MPIGYARSMVQSLTHLCTAGTRRGEDSLLDYYLALAGCTTRLALAELPPPGGGLITTMKKVAGTLSSGDRRPIVNRLELTNVEERVTPLNMMVEFDRKFRPSMASIWPAETAAILAGTMAVMVGEGFSIRP